MTRLRAPFLLVLFGLLMTACSWPMLSLPGSQVTGELDVEINYSGEFYHEVFNYARDAANIRHYVMVIPSRIAAQHDNPEWAFSRLDVQADGDHLAEGPRAQHVGEGGTDGRQGQGEEQGGEQGGEDGRA